MSVASIQNANHAVDWPGLMNHLGPRFAARAAHDDATDTFVAEHFTELLVP
jgi:hypothetical protein